ncbi:unnamed protein product [Enterobius vermicularis]|uniref:Ig-like domain-containing protein n=1 Tax=Enterobius vermicularis TaxID=51028 RepID=A0A3P6IVB2_ENTVE|nr:unnamed protein product [Enterobius vermicularis]
MVFVKDGELVKSNDDILFLNEKQQLHIESPSEEDSGHYTCFAENKVGSAEKNVIVTVLPPPKMMENNRVFEVLENDTRTLECPIKDPSVQIRWLKNGIPIATSPNLQFSTSGHKIHLMHGQVSDSGNYTCVATNEAGEARSNMKVIVLAPPHFKALPNELKVVQGHSKTIRCEVTGAPTPEIEWLKDGQKLDYPMFQSSNNVHYIHIRNATLEDAGNYTCTATNLAGKDSTSSNLKLKLTIPLKTTNKNLKVVTIAVVPSIASSERLVQVKENTTLSLDCVASGNPTPKISWLRNGVLIKSFEGPRLVIEAAQASDAGSYSCEAVNEAGKATANFEVDVFIKPRFKDLESEVRVIEGERARLECKAEGHPPPVITWLRGGRPIETMHNSILSPHGETLMILKSRRSDAGGYSCVAENFAGPAEAPFKLTVLVKPYIEEAIDQNPRVVNNRTIVLRCPVLGISQPKVCLFYKHTNCYRELHYFGVSSESDAGRYTCFAENEAGSLSTDLELEVIVIVKQHNLGPPKWPHDGNLEYEVKVGETVTMDCTFRAEPKPDILWYYKDSPLYLSENKLISSSGEQLTIRGAQLSDGGKYTCKAINEAGSAQVDMQLKVLVPPVIDKSNVIGNPLANAGSSIFLECPVSGIPPPTVKWFREGDEIDPADPRLSVTENNQTFGINNVMIGDEGHYYCLAENKGGYDTQEFDLEVLVAPEMDSHGTQKIVKSEDDNFVLTCPVRKSLENRAPAQIIWYKDNRSIDATVQQNVKLSSDSKKLHIMKATVSDAGNYSCYAFNRAGERHMDFTVEILCRVSKLVIVTVMSLRS